MSAAAVRAGMIALMAALAAACGFEPMYGARQSGGSAASDLGAIELAPIVDAEGGPFRLGLLMKNALSDRLYASGSVSPRYRLEMTVERDLQGFGFRPDEAVTRYGLKLTAHYRLIDLATGNTTLEESARAYNSYDVVQSDFATLMAERNMEERLTRDLGERISSRLGLYFRNRNATAPTAP